jgi:hypothetical protein
MQFPQQYVRNDCMQQLNNEQAANWMTNIGSRENSASKSEQWLKNEIVILGFIQNEF